MSFCTPEHLRSIDAEVWPNIATVPSQRWATLKSRWAEAEFAKACDNAGLELELDVAGGPDLKVGHDALFKRIAATGWLGFAESYMAGEWSVESSTQLVKVLAKLLQVGYLPKPQGVRVRDSEPGELPLDLVRLYAGDELSHVGGIFSSGVPTTIRETVESFGPRTGSREPKSHFVDVTTVSEPTNVDRNDLGEAQRRAADWLLDATRTGTGTHLLVYPAAGMQAAIRATKRRATVDVLTSDVEQITQMREALVFAGTEDSIRIERIPDSVPSPKQWRGHYDAIISVEKFEQSSPRERKAFVQVLDRLLTANGRAAFQSIVATESMSEAARASLQAMRTYIWPGLDYPLTMDVYRLVDKNSNLRIVSETHVGSHYIESLRQQRSFFDGHLREAAAAGYDQVFRRLWTFQFALREALMTLGMIDSVQFGLAHRSRGGRR
ncbi:SAM-dependent methyltransferase [Corynebacterium macginleyi]|uniref:SAM-dependent methyltransferase n=1 Tax=Corynebacterium macginleyi TaxID=38290 RepID=A0A3M0GYJ7_9CORY|nr:class I SAM-dependent methyltransferase [Corynebacterium macginleyi]MBK4140911.1 SAM-dependent methyltransferase [Corynebacterium macginleyi]MBK4143217.1 SAM-dependent methyltransferase [Corynebacterium macginleyi]MBK4150203.1 SAM-dependent methyltransferase [Corynebacterium macginleyi]MBK4152559.1 SAM-dependent methyltransferase [Corynebacterium macginleyi]MBK4157709.1 SAM-dependent methyltransferase [Corynebacterium macginleyi]